MQTFPWRTDGILPSLLPRDTDLRISVQRSAWHAAGVAAAFVLFSAPGIWTRAYGREPSYLPATLAFTALLLALVAWWGQSIEPQVPRAGFRRPLTLLVAATASVVVVAGAWRWLWQILLNPIDAAHGDMLPVLDAAIGRALQGHDPYAIYHVPWDAAFGYGPVLWVPFLVPHFLHADLRLAALAGALVVPAWCAVAAVADAARGRLAGTAIWLVLAAAILASPDLTSFMPIAHTPVFWPLLPLLALLITAERWSAAAFVLGLVVVGRTTMVAAVPVFFSHLWIHHRRSLARALAWWLAPIAVLIGPFAAWDPRMLWYCMVAVYPRVIKATTWLDPTGGIAHTFGLTGWLVSHGLGQFVEVSQVCAVAAVWAIAWRCIRRGARPLPWMALAVLAFCMTTLSPVYYIYFDALMLFAAAALAEGIGPLPLPVGVAAWSGTVAVSIAVVLIALVVAVPAYPQIDFAAEGSRRYLYGGFAFSRREGEPSLPWIWGYDAIIALPRGSATGTAIVISAEPVVGPEGPPQHVTAFLNGRPLGTVEATSGWHSLRFAAPHAAWLIGSNALKLVCSSATSPILIGMSDDPRHLALAVQRVEVVR